MINLNLHVEKCIKFHAVFYPVFGSIVLLGQDYLRILNNFEDFFQDTKSLISFVAIFLLFQLSIGTMYYLLKSIKNRSMKHLNIYIIIQFTSWLIINIILTLKDQQRIQKQLPDSFWPFFFFIYVYLMESLLFGINLFQFKENLRIEKGNPVQKRIFGIHIDQVLFIHIGILIILTIRDFPMVYAGWSSYFDRVLQFLPLYIIFTLLNVLVRLAIYLFCIAVKTRDAKWIWRYRFVKLLFQIPLCIVWTILTYQWFNTTPRIAIQKHVYLQPIFFFAAFTIELILLQYYSNHFKDRTNNNEDEEFLESFKLVYEFCITQNIPLLNVKFELGVEDNLGEGQFGEVRKGMMCINNTEVVVVVAVKFMKKEFTSNETFSSLISEIKTLQSTENSHENLIKFYGVMKSTTNSPEFGVVMEYCSLGSLVMYFQLKRAEKKFPDNIGTNDLKKLKCWALEIASAMDFLGNLNIIHADLSARNILLDENESAKVTDFGMSLRLYNYSLYARSNQSIFPWRWMAPESLADLTFSTRSDVYSYGVLLWEIFSFGDTPWEGTEWTSDFVQILKTGKCLERPLFASTKLYSNVIRGCLCVEETERLDFKEIQIRLLADEDGYINTLDCKKFT